MLKRLIFMSAMVTAALLSSSALARVTQFQIKASGAAFEGKLFGKAGGYERIDAIATFAVDPKSPRVADIVDIDLAPVNALGEVVFSTEVSILRPANPGQRSPILFYEVPNRGRNLSFTLLNRSESTVVPSAASEAGDGFLMNRGDTIVWSGWQTGLADEFLNIDLPVLGSVTGRSREQFIFDKPGRTSAAKLTYPAADLDLTKAKLTVRAREGDEPQQTAGLSFRYLSPTEIEITRPADMDAGAIYEFIYPAKDAVPAGLAFIATSDLISFLRGNEGHEAENPLGGVKYTIGMGISQSGRFLRDLIYQGFNADEKGNRVFDGAIPHIAGSRKTFTNFRFAQPGRYSRQHEDHDYPGDQFPFTYAETDDPLSGKSGSILSACSTTETCPKIMHTDTSTEFWQARASLVTTSPDGKPLKMPDNVRLYFIAGAPHFNPWSAKSVEDMACVYSTNPLSAAPVMRPLYVAMANWISENKVPPASRFPSLTDGTLVRPDELKLPKINGEVVRPVFNELRVMDYATQPPTRGKIYPVHLPAVDADGNPLGGIRMAYVQAPLGTYAGWNLRKEGFGEGELCSLAGTFIPFPKEPSEADSRKALSERYHDNKAHVAAVEAAAQALVAEGLMLPDDIGYVVERARQDSASLR
ncbi:alpha/beta hydrolase domain-containing protein [Pararhizobium sp. A13]|uniref:alpha/beta hydrolase domain-containing protein n=1 Tax=Pararhizobium sp. A13 TaxID=3133975 RepID=UPI00311AC640